MRKLRIVRKALVHICIICTLVCVTGRILDWYNPYMDFMGHLYGAEIVLYGSVLINGIIELFCSRRRKKEPGIPGLRAYGEN